MIGWMLVVIGSLLMLSAIVFFSVLEMKLYKRQQGLIESYEMQQQEELLLLKEKGTRNAQ